MYEELIQRLREESEIERWLQPHSANEIPKLLDDAAHAIEKLSKERKTGVWIGEGDGYADGFMVYDIWSCGCCGTRFDEWEEEPDWKYCPVCGSYNGGDEDV